MMKHSPTLMGIILAAALLAACRPASGTKPAVVQAQPVKILAVESFLADLTQHVAGERAAVDVMIPIGLDPHAFEPAPKDVARVAESSVLVVNGAGLEEWLAETLQNAGGQRLVIEASSGLTPRSPAEPEQPSGAPGEAGGESDGHKHEIDPHFWFDPLLAIHYVENIRAGLTEADPQGAEIYQRNAGAYIAELKQLDAWIAGQVAGIPAEQRLMVTNHESFGYFADRYGFKIIGAVLPSVSSGASPSARQLAELIAAIRASGAKAIFLETGANPELAEQISEETGAKVITGLYTHSLSPQGGPAATYIDMMKYNVSLIVSALK